MTTLVAHPLHVARVRDDLVVLDLRRGAYEMAAGVFEGPLEEAQARARVAEVLGTSPAEPAAPLGGTGRGCDRAWRRGLEPDLDLAVGRRDRRDFCLAWLTLAATYPGAPLRRLLSAEPRPARVDTRETLRRAAVFAELLPWAPWPGACLYRAYLLRLFLRRGGADADWAFGVRTWPFRAHCWLEAHDVVLNDDPAAVRAYTPILRA